MLRLRCVAQQYDWGLRAADGSEVAELARLQGEELQAERPYAELWMGTHPSGPSAALRGGGARYGDPAARAVPLRSWLGENPEALGEDPGGPVRRMAAAGGGAELDLPFLFKVLSVRKALSIQAHPDKRRAAALHAERPGVYKDPNHKPEMTVAVTPFEAMSGFVPADELLRNLDAVPELRAVVGEARVEAYRSAVASSSSSSSSSSGDGSDAVKPALRAAFSALMLADKDGVAEQVRRLVARIADKEEGARTRLEALVLRLHSQYPFDVGILCAFFLNVVTLSPGEGVYLEANEPHAYLSGQCVEVMATSDNVVRAGLTPKLRDTEVLCEMLTYAQGPPAVMAGTRLDAHTLSYSPPFDEFALAAIDVRAGETYVEGGAPAAESPSILLCLEGDEVGVRVVDERSRRRWGDRDGESTEATLARGSVFFVVAGARLEVTASARSDAKLYRATCNGRIFA